MAKYIYYNINPTKSRINDCTVRAISLATGTEYSKTKKLMEESAIDLNCCKMCLPCYIHLLEDYFGLETHEDYYHTAGEIADIHPFDVVLIRMEGHITVAIGGSILDEWDCRDSICTHYWIV